MYECASGLWVLAGDGSLVLRRLLVFGVMLRSDRNGEVSPKGSEMSSNCPGMLSMSSTPSSLSGDGARVDGLLAYRPVASR